MKDKTIDTTKEFMKGAILGYCQTRTPEEVGELFDITFQHLKRNKAADVCLAITAQFFAHYDKENKND